MTTEPKAESAWSRAQREIDEESLNPTPVVLVTPRVRKPFKYLARRAATGLILLALNAWLLTLLLPAVLGLDWGFWQCVGLLMIFRILLPLQVWMQPNKREFFPGLGAA